MTTLSFDCSPRPPKGGPMTPEREQAIRDWLERQAFNDSEGLACARDLMEALDQERARVAKLERVVELVKEDRFGEDFRGKVTITHGRFFAVQHRPDTYCLICEALAALEASDE